MSNKKNEELLAENEHLRLRLEEAEETLRAIGSGEVDAFVVSGADGAQQVFTLKGAEQPYRILVENMSEGAATLASDGTILYCNNRLASLLHVPLENMIGAQIGSYVAPADLPLFFALLDESIGKLAKIEMTMLTGTGSAVPVFFSCCAHDLSGNSGVSVVITDLTKQKHHEKIVASEEALRASEERLALATSATQIGMFDQDLNKKKVLWTQTHATIFGYAPATTTTEYDNNTWSERVHPDDLPRVMKEKLRCMMERTPVAVQYRIIWPDGSLHWVESRGVYLYDGDGNASRMLGVVLDITERKRVEGQIKASLAEKEVLLKEIHHRVKNNLQVISSLISLQADGSKDETVCQVLKDVTYRLRSMALVHENLYLSSDLAHIDFAEYTRALLSYLWLAHGAFAADVRMTLDLGPVSLLVDTAVTCGLILNELAVNALKHAFQGRSDGEVKVSLHCGADRRIRLCVTDNGVGLPVGFDWRQTRSLGLCLVQMLSRQLDATAEVSSGDGTKFEIIFENPASSPS